MTKSIVIAERDNIAAILEDDRVMEFFVNRGDVLLGDVYLAKVLETKDNDNTAAKTTNKPNKNNLFFFIFVYFSFRKIFSF